MPTPNIYAPSTKNGGSPAHGKPPANPPLPSHSSIFPTLFEPYLCLPANLPFHRTAGEPKLHLGFPNRRALPLCPHTVLPANTALPAQKITCTKPSESTALRARKRSSFASSFPVKSSEAIRSTKSQASLKRQAPASSAAWSSVAKRPT